MEPTPHAPAARTLVVLGCGTSMGVPVVGCPCGVCRSTDPRNSRTRPSVLLQLPGGNALVDTTPEMRLQLLREKVEAVHAVAYTHYHVDHLYGLDDARIFPKYLGGPLPIYCAEDVEAVIRNVFGYAFHPAHAALPPGYLPKLEFRRVRALEPFELLGERVTPVPLRHGRFDVLGFRVRDLAYCTDVSEIPPESWPLLEGLDTLILDCLRDGAPHPTHLNLVQALEVIAKLRPRRAYLTHMSHEIDYEATLPHLPPHVRPAHDGLRIPF